MIYTKDDSTYITKSILVPNNNLEVNSLYKTICKQSIYINTQNILKSALEAPRLQTEEVKIVFSEEQLTLINNILNSNLSFEDKKEIIKSIDYLKDFYFLAFNIFDVVSMVEKNKYKISELEYIDTLCKNTGVKSEANNIISTIPSAEKNTKVLNLIKRIHS